MKFQLILSLAFIFLWGCNASKDSSLSVIANKTSDISSLPRLYTDNTGTVFMAWVESEGNISTLNYASINNEGWSNPSEIATDSTWFINWADFPSIIARNGKPVAAHWLDKIPGNRYSYNINISGFDGEWTNPITPHNDQTATEHGFVSMIPASDSTFLAIWLDGRNTAGRSHHQYSDISKAMTLRGAFLNNNAEVLVDFELDENVCDCCNTSITRTETGFIAAYRDRTENEIRDIKTISYVDGVWQKPKLVHGDNWQIAACPVNGPAIDSQDNYVAVAWLTAADDKPIVKMSISEDNGEHFAEPIIIDKDQPIGRVDLSFSGDKIWLSWISNSKTEGSLNIQSYNLLGNPISSFSIPEVSKSRSSGFPQITVYKDGLLIAYTDITGENPVVRTVLIE